LPEIKSRPALAGLPAPTQLDPKGEQLRLQQAIFQLLRGAAALRPTVVVFENAHWADEASLDLLAFLTRTPSIPGLMICVTYRGEEVPTKHLLETITGNQIRRMHLKRLSPEATKQLAASMLGLKELPRALADRVQQATGGNPFFIQELIRSLAEDSTLLQRTPGGWQINERALVRAALPSSIQQTLAHRIERLPHHEREMLCWAATLGPIFWDGALARLGNLTREQVQEPLVALTAKELIAPRQSTAIPGEREYAFRHADLCGMVCDLLPNPQRAHLHAQAANWLIERTADRQDDFSGQIGEHLAAAGQPEAAITYLRRVGELAAARFANESALIWYQRALALFDHLGHSSAPAYLPQHLETHAAISDVLILLGRYEEALEQLEAARKLLEGKTLTLDRLRFFADLCRTTAQVYEKRSEYSLAQEWVDRGLRYLNLQPETVELARLYNLSGWLHMRQGDYAGALVELEKAFSAAQAANAPAEATNTLTVQGAVANRQGRYPDAQAYLERALAAARAANDKRAEASAQNTLGLVYFNRGDFVRSAECQEQAIALRRAIGDRQGEVSPLGNLASTHWARGDYAKARQAYDTELRLAHEIGDRWAEGAALNNLGTLYTELGSYQEANGCFEQAIPIKRAIGDREGESVLLSNLCWLHHLLNDNQAAYEYGVKALTQARTSGYRRHEAYCLIYLGHALGGLKRWPEAESAYQQSADLRAELGQTNLRIEALAGVVRAALAQGETARAVQVTEELLTHIKEHALDGADEPLRIYYTCYQALRQANDPRARSAIETAYAQLQARANKIGDEATRQAFLQNVAVNRAIVQEAGADRWKEG
jgi:predicted ATPase